MDANRDGPARSTRVVVLFGGQNTEHTVSVSSAATVVRNLDRTRYTVTPIRITPAGHWSSGHDRPGQRIDEVTVRLMTPEPAAPSESFFQAVNVICEADVVMPVLHGPYHENGTVQSVLDYLDVPYVGSGALTATIAMDRDLTKRLLTGNGITVAPGVTLDEGEQVSAADRQRLGLPLFVKPVRDGSSFAVSRVRDLSALPAAVAGARRSEARVMVEAAVPGREVAVGVLEMPDGRLLASPPLEARMGEGQARRRRGFTDHIVPADLGPATTARIREEAVRVFRTLGCAGLLRVGFLVGPGGELTVNDVKPMPELTALSPFPRMWHAAGLPYPELLDLLIRTARRRATGRSSPAPGAR